MARQNFYDALGLKKGASAKEIKSAYYKVLSLNMILLIVYKDTNVCLYS